MQKKKRHIAYTKFLEVELWQWWIRTFLKILMYILKVPFRNILPTFIPIAMYEALSTHFSTMVIITFSIFVNLTDEKSYHVIFLLLVRLNFFMFVGDLYLSLGEWPVQFLCPFLFLQRVVYLLSSICISLCFTCHSFGQYVQNNNRQYRW